MSQLKATAEDVRHAYRLLLGREPDSTGFEHHCNHALATGASPTEVADTLMRSDEFKSRGLDRPLMQKTVLRGVQVFPWRGDRLIGDNLILHGDYEPHVLPLFVEAIRPGDTVLDVGANIGIYSLSAAAKTGPQGRVFSIEPVAKNVQSLCAGIHANGFGNVSVLPVAASSSATVIGVLRHDDSSNGIVDASATGSMSTDFVPTQRLDLLLGFLDRLDVVKIDIEGHEPLAWPGIVALVEKHGPVIFTEFSPAAIRNHSRVPPETYLDQLFAVASDGITMLLGGKQLKCSSTAEIMREWRRLNDLPDDAYNGVIHVDLMLRARRAASSQQGS